MHDDTSSDEIGQLEARVEALAESIERCRKISFVSKLAIAAGVFFLVLLLVMPLPPSVFVAAMAAVIGGIVMLGSNSTTWEQTSAALADAEAARAEAIGTMQLRLVGEEPRTIH
jgi:hypothetical protein